MNIVICDDSEILLNMMVKGCEKYKQPGDNIEGYVSSKQLKEILLEKKPEVDLFILDIDMSEVNGMELKDIISQIYEETNIVFATDYASYMPEAFGKKVIGFLLKKDFEDRIGEMIAKVREELSNDRKIQITDGQEKEELFQKRILSISAQRVYSVIRYVEYYNADTGELRVTEKTYRIPLREWEEKLEMKEFCRINRSTIVSWRYVKNISDKINMKNGDSYRIPAGKKRNLREMFMNYIVSRS
ncbi:MAG: response regulator [Clostridiales bacterium]|nr:response regulator [Clostridiales bacterium]